MNHPQKTRILEVVGGMNRGGVETWLMHVLRHMDATKFQMDFLVHQPGQFDYTDEIRALGGKLLLCEGTRNPWTYRRNFNRLMRAHGPYDVVHAHVHHFNGLVMRLASAAGIPMRIAHSHLDYAPEHANAGLLRNGYFRLMNRWIDRYATHGFAVSRKAAGALFGAAWESRPDRRLMYCGIDLSPFRVQVSSRQLRTALGIPAEAFVIGHAGRMTEQKNHAFLIEVFAEVARRAPNACLLLVGDGPLRGKIESQVRALGLSERVIFAGVRPDVPHLMLAAMDLFVFPSLFEGLPLVGMEVQAAGLPMIVADTVTPEMAVVPELVKWLSLSSPATVWADAVLSIREGVLPVTKDRALQAIEMSPFNIERGVKELELIYSRSTLRDAPRPLTRPAAPEQALLQVGSANRSISG